MLLTGSFIVLVIAAIHAVTTDRVRVAALGNLVASGLTALVLWGLSVSIFRSGVWTNGFWVVDRFGALMLTLVAIVYVGASVASLRYIGQEHDQGIISARVGRMYYALLPVFVLAMEVTVTTDHLGVLWIALEATTLATTPLVALYRKDGAIEAAWKYLLLCSVGISVSLLGLLLLAYAGVRAGLPVEEAMSLGALRARATLLEPQVVRWAFAFLFVGIGTKVGFVPMHPWLPDAHSRTPSPISATLSGILLNVALYALLRTRSLVDASLGQSEWTAKFFWVFGLGSVLFAAFVLLHQQNYKRMLAYSSVEHMGLMAFALGMGPLGAAAAVMHMVGHTLAKSALFFSAGEVLLQRHTTKIPNVRGLWRTAPITSVAFLVALLGLLGAPVSAIFASELTMILAAARRSPGSAVAVIVALAIVLIGLLHHVFGMLHGSPGEAGAGEHDVRWSDEPFGLIHGVVAVELLLLFAAGVFFLTAPGLAFASSIAATFTVQP